MMCSSLNLTVKVLHLSPSVTIADLNIFFSYCGTIETIHLQRYKDQLQMAYVTFRQPYAFQTALLLNGAIVGKHPISILPLQDSEVPIIMDDDMDNETQQGLIPAVQVVAAKSVEMLNKNKDKKEKNYKMLEKGKEVVHLKTRSAICAVEQTAGNIGNAIIKKKEALLGMGWEGDQMQIILQRLAS